MKCLFTSDRANRAKRQNQVNWQSNEEAFEEQTRHFLGFLIPNQSQFSLIFWRALMRVIQVFVLLLVIGFAAFWLKFFIPISSKKTTVSYFCFYALQCSSNFDIVLKTSLVPIILRMILKIVRFFIYNLLYKILTSIKLSGLRANRFHNNLKGTQQSTIWEIIVLFSTNQMRVILYSKI